MPSTYGNAMRRFATLAWPFFRSEVRWRAWAMLGLLVALLLAISGLNIVNSYVGRFFISSVTDRDERGYIWFAFLYVGVFAASTLVDAFRSYAEQRMGLFWREWLTTHLIRRYLTRHAYYRLTKREDIDNPDQRISEDVKNFTTTTLSFLLMILNSTITAFAFLGVLWSITPWLFFVSIGYAIFGSVMTILIGHRLVSLNNLQLKKEADFRFALVHVREHAEAMAYANGEKSVAGYLGERLHVLVQNFKSIIAVSRNVAFFTGAYNYLMPFIPLLLAAPLYMKGKVEFGVVTQAAMAFAQVVGAFSLIIVQFQNISTFVAVIGRLGSLWEAIEGAERAEGRGLELVDDEQEVGYEDVSLWTPKEHKVLVEHLRVKVEPGKRLLILGPHGAGKTALVRATAGLWDAGAGRIARPAGEKLSFVPQRPYWVPGSLRRQLLCGHTGRPISDDELQEVLRRVGLEPVVRRIGGLDVVRDWPNVLSIGEQQLLSFARLLLRRPPFAILDEPAKGLNPARARELYRLVSEAGITYISVADNTELRGYHEALLELQGDGHWATEPIELPAAG